MLYNCIDVTDVDTTSFDHDMPAGGGYRLCLRQKVNHHENEAEHPTIEKYLRTLMANQYISSIYIIRVAEQWESLCSQAKILNLHLRLILKNTSGKIS